MKFRIEEVQQNNVAVAGKLRADMAEEFGRNWDIDYPGWAERFGEYFAKKKQVGLGNIFYCYVNDDAVAMICVVMTDDYHVHTRGMISGRINSLYVKPEFRRQGIGKLLMATATDWLKQCGCKVVRLNSSEQGLALYESLGFKPRREMELQLH